MTAADPNVLWHLPPALRQQLLGPNGLRLPEWLESGQAAVIKQAPHRSIYHVKLDDLDFYLKEYRTIGLQGKLRELARPVKARTEYRRGARRSWACLRRGRSAGVCLAIDYCRARASC